MDHDLIAAAEIKCLELSKLHDAARLKFRRNRSDENLADVHAARAAWNKALDDLDTLSTDRTLAVAPRSGCR